MSMVTDFEDDKFPFRLLKCESMSAKCHSQYYFYLNLDNQMLLLDSISSVNLCLEFQIHHFVFFLYCSCLWEPLLPYLPKRVRDNLTFKETKEEGFDWKREVIKRYHKDFCRFLVLLVRTKLIQLWYQLHC